jgi:hypothetical protein
MPGRLDTDLGGLASGPGLVAMLEAVSLGSDTLVHLKQPGLRPPVGIVSDAYETEARNQAASAT